jgi:hypothetical protein
MWNLIKELFGWIFSGSGTGTGKSVSGSSMNEGDYHSGPHGYSPNTAYSETEYGDPNWEDEQH